VAGSSGSGGGAGSAGSAGSGGIAGGAGTGGKAGSGGTGGSAGSSGSAGSGGSGGIGGSGGTGGTGGTAGTGGSGGCAGTGGAGGCEIVAWHFDSGAQGWTASGTNNDWQCAVPTNGPSGDHTGNGGRVWQTGSSKAANCENSTLVSPVVNLSAYVGQALRLRFWHWFEFNACVPGGLTCSLHCSLDKSTYSGGIVEAFNGSAWQKIEPPCGYSGQAIDCYSMDPDAGPTCSPCDLDGVKGFDGSSGGAWVMVEMDVSGYAVAQFQARFHFASYAWEFLCHPNKRGWIIDDVAVVKLGPC
jgi:hypothetical protein